MDRFAAYLTVASIFIGFAITVLMFRIQRELHVREKRPEWPNWLAWADYLILASIVLCLVFVVLPLLTIQRPSELVLAIAQASCAASAILLAAYPFAILDHYRIEIGAKRTGDRVKGEPIERILVIGAFTLAVSVGFFIVR
jgi:cytochrome bd-type quinol oxidase subunit 2